MKKIIAIIVFLIPFLAFSQHPEWTVYNTSNSGLPNNTIPDLIIDNYSNKWIGTYGLGLVIYNGKDWNIINMANSSIPNNFIRSLAIDSDGHKWIGTENGLTKFDDANWTKYPNSVFRFVLDVAIDSNRNTWITNYGGGLGKIDSSGLTIYNKSNSGLGCNDAWAILIDPDSSVWIGAYGGGLVHFDDENWTIYKTSNSGIPDNKLRSLAIDNEGILWVGTWGGLAKFDRNNWTVYDTTNSLLPANYVGDIAIDMDGNKWIATENGLAKYNDESWQIYNTSNSGLPDNDVLSIAIDSFGKKWIGTRNGGLAVFDDRATYIENDAVNISDISIVPNPITDFAIIELTLNKIGKVEILITDLFGNQNFSICKESQKKGKCYYNLDFSMYPSGTYFTNIKFNGNIISRKIIVVH